MSKIYDIIPAKEVRVDHFLYIEFNEGEKRLCYIAPKKPDEVDPDALNNQLENLKRALKWTVPNKEQIVHEIALWIALKNSYLSKARSCERSAGILRDTQGIFG
jgi:hypothetical protein